MKVLVLAPDFPFPPSRGGKVDVWRRMKALRDAGAEIALVSCYEIPKSELESIQHSDEFRKVVDYLAVFELVPLAMSSTLKKVGFRRLPWHVARRTPERAEMEKLTEFCVSFSPDYIWLEGPWLGEVARVLRLNLGSKMLYRSHNIEHQYMWSQASAATSFGKRLSWRASCLWLKRYQLELMRELDHVFDISYRDVDYWRSQGINDITWMPPLSFSGAAINESNLMQSDVAFTGNLKTPNNVAAAKNLLSQIVPRVRAINPSVDFLISGSSPDRDLLQAAMAAKVRVLPDVEDIRAVQQGARILISPVTSGGGVQLKIVDMLSTDNPILTSPQGVYGLPGHVASAFDVFQTWDECAELIIEYLSGRRNPDLDLRRRARSEFSAAGFMSRIGDIS